jgi:hypothetical protein
VRSLFGVAAASGDDEIGEWLAACIHRYDRIEAADALGLWACAEPVIETPVDWPACAFSRFVAAGRSRYRDQQLETELALPTTLELVSDPDEKAAVLQAKGKKYPEWTVPSASKAAIFRVLPQ